MRAISLPLGTLILFVHAIGIFQTHLYHFYQMTLLLEAQYLINEDFRFAKRYFYHVGGEGVPQGLWGFGGGVRWAVEVILVYVVELKVAGHATFYQVIYAS